MPAPGPAPRGAPPADLGRLLADLDRECLPHLSVNGVVFGAHAGALSVLLLRAPGTGGWQLPGGYVRRGEAVDDAAARVVRERTGLGDAVLRQFHTFGATDRGEAALAPVLRALGVELPAGHWALGRVVSVGYLALVDAGRARVAPDALTAESRWWDAAARPPLLFDHGEMVERALAVLRARLDALPLGATLLPGAFTMPELQRLYETVLGRPLDRRNFQRRMLELGLVARLPGPGPRAGAVGRPGHRYRWVDQGAAG